MPCIGIIGGGAAGMMAALTAAENPDHSVYLFEKQPRVGKKLLATGNGRCNLSNLHAGPAHYFGDPEMAAAVLDVFSVQDTLCLLYTSDAADD